MFYPIHDNYKDMYDMCIERKDYSTAWVLYYLADEEFDSPTSHADFKDVNRTMEMIRQMQTLKDIDLAQWLCKNINKDRGDLILMPDGINFKRYQTYDGTFDIYFGECSGLNIIFVDGFNSPHTKTKWSIETKVKGYVVRAHTDAAPVAFQRAVLKKAAQIASGEFTPEVLSPI